MNQPNHKNHNRQRHHDLICWISSPDLLLVSSSKQRVHTSRKRKVQCDESRKCAFGSDEVISWLKICLSCMPELIKCVCPLPQTEASLPVCRGFSLFPAKARQNQFTHAHGHASMEQFGIQQPALLPASPQPAMTIKLGDQTQKHSQVSHTMQEIKGPLFAVCDCEDAAQEFWAVLQARTASMVSATAGNAPCWKLHVFFGDGFIHVLVAFLEMHRLSHTNFGQLVTSPLSKGFGPAS